jgi:hypothetical protein
MALVVGNVRSDEKPSQADALTAVGGCMHVPESVNEVGNENMKESECAIAVASRFASECAIVIVNEYEYEYEAVAGLAVVT